MKVDCRPFFERKARATATCIEGGDDVRDDGVDDR
jgi:hypothetical protein